MNASFPVDEDCLQLNVWSPAVASDENLPVLVWAFGGGLTTGSGRTCNGTLLANLGRMVVVTVNYRVGALGFYASSEQQAEDQATGGLNGVLDILHALRFVHKHIPSFHGDAKRVALSGESERFGRLVFTRFHAARSRLVPSSNPRERCVHRALDGA